MSFTGLKKIGEEKKRQESLFQKAFDKEKIGCKYRKPVRFESDFECTKHKPHKGTLYCRFCNCSIIKV